MLAGTLACGSVTFAHRRDLAREDNEAHGLKAVSLLTCSISHIIHLWKLSPIYFIYAYTNGHINKNYLL